MDDNTNIPSCPICDDEFDGENAKQQHLQAKHPDYVQSSKSFSERINLQTIRNTGLLLLVLIIIGSFIYIMWPAPTTIADLKERPLPKIGDHWHAQYTIKLCGETIQSQPYSDGQIHTHGNGMIHVHPKTAEKAGENANLKTFFASFGGKLTNTTVSVPGHKIYQNGDKCSGTPGEVAVYVNQKRLTNPASYVPRRQDKIRITFTSKQE